MKKKRDLLIYLEDISESSELIATYIADISEGSFYNSTEKQDAVLLIFDYHDSCQNK